MIKFDTHIHTYPFSCDSHQKIDAIMSTNAKSQYGYILTEHMDYDYPIEGKFQFNVDDYFEQYHAYRGERLLLGVEMGLTTTNLEKVGRTVDKHQFDMVIGSIHCVGDEDIAFPDYSERYSKKEAYSKYLTAMEECLEKYHDFDTLAHVDYICRYSKYSDPELYVCDHREALSAIFSFLVEHDICLELNTRRIATENGFRTVNELMRFYAYLGGKYVTVGSDSHYIENLSMNFNLAEKILKDNKLIPVYFKNRKRIEM